MTDGRTAVTSGSTRDGEGPRTIVELLERAVDDRGDAIALVIGDGDEQVSFEALRDRAAALADRYAALGVGPGDRVVVWMRNSVDAAVALLAPAWLGAVAAPVNTRWTPAELEPLLDHLEPRLVVVEEALLPPGPAADRAILGRAERPVLLIGQDRPGDAAAPGRPIRVAPGRLGLDADGDPERRTPHEPAPGRDRSADCDSSVALILATSGTTARPKAVMLEHRALVRLARAIALRQDLGPEDRLYTVAPLYHCSGFVHGLLTTLAAGARLVMTRKYVARETGTVLRSQGITSYHGFSLPLREASELPDFDPDASRSLRAAWFSAPADEMADLEDRYGVPMCELYGLTESGGNSVMTGRDDPIAVRHRTDGAPHPGIEVAVFEPGGEERIERGGVGEIRIRGWNLMRGYFHDEAATEAAIDGDGWLRTGDLGVLDAQGRLTFLSRLDDVVRVGGENVDPAEVERVLESHPLVGEAAAIGVPHARLGQVLVAFVVPTGPATDLAEALPIHCGERLASFKVPRRVFLEESLPRTAATGRLQRSVLRRRYEHLAAVADGPD